MQTSRAFIAVEVGPPAASVLQRLLGRLQQSNSGVRWVRDEQLHVTLKFLGDIDNRELPAVCDVMGQICSGREPFTVQVSELGTFPRGKPPRVIWAGIRDGVEPLLRMHEELDVALQELGVPSENRAFSPHLTLGRVNRGCDANQLLKSLQTARAELDTQFEVEEVKLLASVKERGGIYYDTVSTVNLVT